MGEVCTYHHPVSLGREGETEGGQEGRREGGRERRERERGEGEGGRGSGGRGRRKEKRKKSTVQIYSHASLKHNSGTEMFRPRLLQAATQIHHNPAHPLILLVWRRHVRGEKGAMGGNGGG